MESEGLDWGNAEVLLLDDASEEQEALLVVPAQAAVGQRLWDRGRPPIDEDQALYVKMRVKKTTPQGSSRPQLQVVKPTPERPVVKPVAKKGVELKPAFSYCPFRYYGRLSSFSRVLCQDSWEQWYKKQWDKRLVQKRILQAANLLTQDAYNISYAWDRKKGIDLITAGFKDLDLSRLQRALELAATIAGGIQTQLPPELLERWNRAVSLIGTITNEELKGWFNALSQAIEQGRFEEEYNRLLPQGLERVQEALLILMDTQDLQKAKELIYKGSKVWARIAQISPEVSEDIKRLMDEVRKRLLSIFFLVQHIVGLIPGLSDILATLGVEDLFGLVDLLIGNWDTAIRVLHIAGFSDMELLNFSKALHAIAVQYAPYFRFATPGIIIRAIYYTIDLVKFLNWMTSPYVQNRAVRDRLEQGFGTIVVAGNLVSNGWEYKGLRLDQGGSYTREGFGDWWGAVLLLTKEKNPYAWRTIVTVSRGDHCVNCGAKADEISSWIGRAVELAPSIQRDNNADVGVVTFAFTNTPMLTWAQSCSA